MVLEVVDAHPPLAATIILVRDDPFEVLMVRRSRTSAFSSALVFPGGRVEPSDFEEDWSGIAVSQISLTAEERAVRIAGVRETFEETAILLALSEGNDPIWPVAGGSFRDLLGRSEASVDLDAIHPFSHWITPEGAPRRFDTYFFLAKAPADQRAIPDGYETLTAEWVSPIELIQRARDGERSIMLPTLMNLTRLAESADTAEAIDAARSRIAFTVRPRIENRSNGDRVVIIPSEAGYGVTEYPAD